MQFRYAIMLSLVFAAPLMLRRLVPIRPMMQRLRRCHSLSYSPRSGSV